jgi:hypothetical protein
MMAPTTNPERRLAPRMNVDNLAYVTLEQGNGGMVLNVSEGGLCFRAVVPVQKTGSIHFRLSEPDLRIEADAEIAWSDETKKKGGLRFTNLSAEGRQQIQEWISRPVPAMASERTYTPRFPAAPKSAVIPESRPRNNVVRNVSPTPPALSPRAQPPTRLMGFSGGLVTGLLVSAALAGVFLIYSHRERLGESLIQWGERLGARSKLQAAPAQVHTGSPQQSSAANSTMQQPTALIAHADMSAPVPVDRSDGQLPQTVPRTNPVQPGVVDSGKLDASKVGPRIPVRSTESLVMDAAVSPLYAPSLPESYTAPVSNLSPAVFAPAPTTNFSGNRVEIARDSGVESAPTKYLEVGNFKEKSGAERTSDRLGQFGFHAIVSQRRRLWASTYHVLVGPYANDHDLDVAHNTLASHGFDPRAFERGSRKFVLRSGTRLNGSMKLNATTIPFGDYTISWESYSTDAVVKFANEQSVVLTTQGKLLKQPFWHDRNAFVYKRNADGSLTLLEIRFGGTNQSLVFRSAS